MKMDIYKVKNILNARVQALKWQQNRTYRAQKLQHACNLLMQWRGFATWLTLQLGWQLSFMKRWNSVQNFQREDEEVGFHVLPQKFSPPVPPATTNPFWLLCYQPLHLPHVLQFQEGKR